MRNFNRSNRTKEEDLILTLLIDNEIEIFTTDMLNDIIENKIKDPLEALALLAKREPALIYRLEKGKYITRSFRNEYVIGNFLVGDGVIAYWSALNLHGLTEQFPNSVFVQTAKQKRQKKIFGVNYNFIKVKKEKLIGIETHGYGNNAFKISDKEKTLVDCFDLPQYSGGYEELIRGFYEAEIDQEKLVEYCKAIKNLAVTKRIAYLNELFEKENSSIFIEFAQKSINKRYVLFDAFGKDEGEHIKKWQLRMNISKEQILALINKQY